MKKVFMIGLALILLAGCAKPTNSADSAEVANLKETIAARDKSIETLINEKETLQALLDQFDPDILKQNSMVFTAIPLLMTSEGKCKAEGTATQCALPSTNGILYVPIDTWPSFMYVLNLNPNQIYIVYYDEKELWVYADYSIVSKAEADAIIAAEGMSSVVKTFSDGRVLMKFATPGLQLSDPAAIDAFNKQFKDKLNGAIDVTLNPLSSGG